MSDARPQVSVKWVKGHRVRIRATRGAVSTEATLTEAEANELAHQLRALLNGWPGQVVEADGADGCGLPA